MGFKAGAIGWVVGAGKTLQKRCKPLATFLQRFLIFVIAAIWGTGDCNVLVALGFWRTGLQRFCNVFSALLQRVFTVFSAFSLSF